MNEDVSFQTLIDTVQGGLILASTDKGTILASNQMAAILLGLPQTEILGRNLFKFILQPEASQMLQDLQKQGMLYNSNGQMISSNGRRFAVQLCLRSMEWDMPVLAFSFSDRTETQLLGALLQKKDELSSQISHLLSLLQSERSNDDPDDYISGVIGMPKLLDKLAVEVGRSHRYGPLLAALQVAIEPIPEFEGEKGKQSRSCVKRVSGSLCVQRARDCDVVGRKEDGSVVVILPNTNLNGALQMAQRLSTALRLLRFTDSGKDYELNAAIGVSILHPGEQSSKLMLSRLDVAVAQARSKGANSIVAIP